MKIQSVNMHGYYDGFESGTIATDAGIFYTFIIVYKGVGKACYGAVEISEEAANSLNQISVNDENFHEKFDIEFNKTIRPVILNAKTRYVFFEEPIADNAINLIQASKDQIPHLVEPDLEFAATARSEGAINFWLNNPHITDLSTCPCCGSRTIAELGGYEICSICKWEDDPTQSANPDYRGGANTESLNEAKEKFIKPTITTNE